MSQLHCLVRNTSSIHVTNRGPLSSLDAVVKDMFDIEGRTNSFGSDQWLQTHEPAAKDAALITQVKDAGLNIYGIAKMDQLAYSLVGNVSNTHQPHNPHWLDCYCGGSSSGPASAVAGALVDIGIGSDTAGSIRVPAAACGLYGLRTTHGRFDTTGMIPLAPSFDTVGLLARHVDDLQKTFNALANPKMARPIRRLLIPVDLFDSTDTQWWAALLRFAELTSAQTQCKVEHTMGAELVNDEYAALLTRIQCREIWETHGEWVNANSDYLDEDIRERLYVCQQRHGDSQAVIQADEEARIAYTAQLRELLGDDTALLLPVLPERGPYKTWNQDQLHDFRSACLRLNAPASLAGLPQLVVPFNYEGDKIPLSFLGASDEALLQLAAP